MWPPKLKTHWRQASNEHPRKVSVVWKISAIISLSSILHAGGSVGRSKTLRWALVAAAVGVVAWWRFVSTFARDGSVGRLQILRWALVAAAVGTAAWRWFVGMFAPEGSPERSKILRRALVAAAVGAVAGWWLASVPTVTAVAAARGTAVEIVYATGAVEPVRWARVASIIRDRIVQICNCEGKTVVKGEVLARLDDREVRAQLQELRAREEFARNELERQTELLGRGSTTTQAHERASMDLRAIQALSSVQLEKLAVRTVMAPIDGVVLRRDGEVGEITEVGQIMFRIGVLKPLQVVAEVNEEDIPRVALGQLVLLRTDAFLGQRLEGKVREITPIGDPVAKTYRIKVALPDDTPLLPGMSVEANVVTREKPNALLIPADALVGTTVLVVDGNRVRRRNVEIGIRAVRAVEITSGLNEGDRVASPVNSALADGRRVRAAEIAAASP
jgi:membrane fusion protein, multidrug efflux system